MWIESKPDGKFKCVERYTDPMTDKVKRVSVTIDKNTSQSRKAAQEILRQKIKKATADVADSKMTFGELTKIYLEHKKSSLKEQSYHEEKRLIETVHTIVPEDVLIAQITARYITMVLDSTHKTNVSKNAYMGVIKRTFKWGYHTGYIDDITFLQRLVPYPDQEKKSRIEDKYLTTEQLHAVINAMPNERWQLMTYFLALSGLRVGEMIALEDKDVTDVIHVDKTFNPNINIVSEGAKSYSGNRDVFIQPELAEVIRKIRTYVKKTKLKYNFRSGIFFPDKDGGYTQYATYYAAFRTATQKAIGRALSPHALRHTHVSLLSEQGVPLPVISRRVGHEDSKITRQIYLHITEKQKEKDNEMLSKIQIL